MGRSAMAKCAHCQMPVRFGGFPVEGLLFCGVGCYRDFSIECLLSQVPDEILERDVVESFYGPCPVCGGEGPNDLFKSYRIWSFIVLTRTVTRQRISCIDCARSRCRRDTLLALLFGWWSLPLGVIRTIVQIARNASAPSIHGEISAPSEALRAFLRSEIMEQMLEAGQLSLDLRCRNVQDP